MRLISRLGLPAILSFSCSCQHVKVVEQNKLLGRCFKTAKLEVQRSRPEDERPEMVAMMLEKGRDFWVGPMVFDIDRKPVREVKTVKDGCRFKLTRIFLSFSPSINRANYEFVSQESNCPVPHFYASDWTTCITDKPERTDCYISSKELKEVACNQP